jgi:PleD family two-component response regulator
MLGSGGTILVVEDDPAISEVLEEALREFGYEVSTAGSGAGALAEMQRSRPDLVLLDLSLPDVDGLDLVRQLRSDQRWNAVPVIALTARDRLSDRVIDIKDFKPYNDRYGFAAGDRIIQQLAEILQQAVAWVRDGFVGHIGGDDFVAVLNADDAVPLAESVLKAFQDMLPTAYTPEDFERGNIEGQDRSGMTRSFPLVALSIAIVVQQGQRYQHIGELSRAAAEIKGYLKQRSGSNYLVERRTV